MQEKDAVICPPCGENVGLPTKEGLGTNKDLPLLPRLTAVLPPQGREMHDASKNVGWVLLDNRGCSPRPLRERVAVGRVRGCRFGFTLIELLVVVLIIAVLAAIALPQYQKAVERSRVTQAITLLKSLAQSQQLYYLTNGQYATKFNQLDMPVPPSWTGNERWGTSDVTDTRSNGDWSLQLFNSSNGKAIYMGRISGPYRGIGFMYWLNRPDGAHPLHQIECFERTYSGITFSGSDGDYCQKILGGTKYNNTARKYTLPH